MVKIGTLSLVLVGSAFFVYAVASTSVQTKSPTRPISFNRDIRPILSEHCYKCHGPSAKEGKGGLRLDDPKSATANLHGHRAIVPGDSANSRLIVRASSTSEELVMPPSDSGMNRLSSEQIQTLKLWIDQGANYEKHWALISPKSPPLPSPAMKEWAKNPIDLFVLQKLEEKRLKPEPQADKPTLLRRVTLTLTGLQPTPKELQDFLADRSPNAYEKVVDRLLASPRYGEHEARYWLDAVRYGDTHGLHLDNERAIYPYRDWVVRAFNQDLSYDKFALWQIAGDLLPQPTTEQLIATGYIRMNPTTSEGGAIADEFQAKNTFDRVDTTSTVFLGLTVACARCHNHKYDPISQQDYYRLFAFFNSTADEPLDGNLLTPGPVIKAAAPEEDRKLKKMESELRNIESQVDANLASKWLSLNRVVFPKVSAWEVSDPIGSTTFDQAFDQESEPGNWKPLDIQPEKDNVFLMKENAYAYVRTTLTAAVATEMGLRFASDDGIKVWLNGTLIHTNKVLRGLVEGVDKVRVKLRAGDNSLLVKVVNATGPGGLRFGLGDEKDKEIEDVSKSNDAVALKKLFLLRGPATKAATVYRAKIQATVDFTSKIPETLVARELPVARPAYVLRRGEYNLPEEKVSREVPKALGELPKNAPLNRLGFAQWLTSKSNPLFGRVFVNRLWQQHFGTGLVKTAEDFGNQGDWPSHPELLDYLATKFESDGLSIKKLNRLIVTSATFRQAAIVTKEKLQVDPENRLLSRGPRFRLDAEVLRDQALFSSGLLFEKRGGHGFKPYQPAGLWEEVAFQESSTAKYKQDMTEEIYRRSLYLFWKRTSPHPVMLTFDAPMREMCVVRRARTNTPLQALVTLNEPAFLEAARSLGQRIAKSAGSLEDKVKLGFNLALSRNPSPAESTLFVRSYHRYLDNFRAEPTGAEELVKLGLAPRDSRVPTDELASWTMLGSTLMNLDEFLTQH